MSSASATIRSHAGAPGATTGFRPDIQGLRAVAVGVVLLYHANMPFLTGGFVGVDVFFVISGFLITGLLLRESLTRGRIDLADFYARRARRILPAATVVLLVTLVLTVAFLPRIRWEQIGIEAAGAAVYIVNWILAGGTDYLNAEVAASPLQHFWTLSVEEQFYIVWPIVLIGMLWLAGKRRARGEALSQARTLQFAGIGVMLILIPSLAWSIFYTSASPAPAYFVTTTRLWELAIGAALAVFATTIARMPDWLGYALGWAGLAGILAASFFYTSTSPAFPGAAALLPTLSAAAIIAGGLGNRSTRGVGRLLSIRPMRWIGDISYSLYLWHWPLIVVGTYLLGGELRFRYGLAIALFSILPAWLSYRFIENPFRDWKVVKKTAARSLWAGGALVALTLVGSTAVVAVPKLTETPTPPAGSALGAEALFAAAESAAPNTGIGTGEPGFAPLDSSAELLAAIRDVGSPVPTVPGGFTPAAVDARSDNSVIYRNDCHVDQDTSTPNGCVFGDEASATSVVIIGDSHAANWVPTWSKLAEDHDWKLTSHTKSACSFSAAQQANTNGLYQSCLEWNDLVLDELIAEQPDLVVTVNAGRRDVADQGELLTGEARLQANAAGLNETWSALNDAGVPVLVINDTPDMGIDVPECVSANPNDLTACATPRAEAVDAQPHPEPIALQGLEAAELIDMNDWICPSASACPVVVGNVMVWRDAQHLTATYARTLAKPLAATLQRSPLAAKILFADAAN